MTEDAARAGQLVTVAIMTHRLTRAAADCPAGWLSFYLALITEASQAVIALGPAALAMAEDDERRGAIADAVEIATTAKAAIDAHLETPPAQGPAT